MKTVSVIMLGLIFCGIGFAQTENDEDRFQTRWKPNSDGLDFQAARVEAIEEVLIPAEEPGLLVDIPVKRGDSVRSGNVVAELDKDSFRIRKQAATIELEIAQFATTDEIDKEFAAKSMELAEKVLERSKKANEIYANTITPTEIDNRRLELERSALSKKKAERDQDVARKQARLQSELEKEATVRLAKRDITSPIDGSVVEIFAHQGEWVSSGAPIMRVVNLDKLQVKAFAEARKFDYRELIGKKVVFTTKMPGSASLVEFNGTITFASPQINYESGEFVVMAEIENADRNLLPGAAGLLRLK